LEEFVEQRRLESLLPKEEGRWCRGGETLSRGRSERREGNRTDLGGEHLPNIGKIGPTSGLRATVYFISTRKRKKALASNRKSQRQKLAKRGSRVLDEASSRENEKGGGEEQCEKKNPSPEKHKGTVPRVAY